MDWSKGEYNPWVAGWLLGKYEQYTRFPTAAESAEWLEGFKVGCAEVCEYEIWQQRLNEHIHGKVVCAELLQHCT